MALGLSKALIELEQWRGVVDFFPNLQNKSLADLLQIHGIQVLTKYNRKYNCYAYALGKRSWLEFYTITQFAHYAAELGFFKSDHLITNFDEEVDAVVLYGCNNSIKHAAKRVKKGWHSKIGRCGIIFHPTLELLAGGNYGNPVASFERPL